MNFRQIITHPLTKALALGLTVGTASTALLARHLNYKNTHRPVTIIPPIGHGHEAVQASRLINNTSMQLNEIWNFINTPEAKENTESLIEKNKKILENIIETEASIKKVESTIKEKQPTAQKISSGGNIIQNSWNYRNHDNYHTEMHSVTTCDDDGCDTHYEPRQVYDNTDHYWTYSPQKCQQGIILLQDGIGELNGHELFIVAIEFPQPTTAQGQNEPKNSWMKNKFIKILNEAANNSRQIRLSNDFAHIQKNYLTFPTSFHERTYWHRYNNPPNGYEQSLNIGKLTANYNQNISQLLTMTQNGEKILDDVKKELNTINDVITGVYPEFSRIKKNYAQISEESLSLLDNFGFEYEGATKQSSRIMLNLLMFLGTTAITSALANLVLKQLQERKQLVKNSRRNSVY